jgi:hypothetical protein
MPRKRRTGDSEHTLPHVVDPSVVANTLLGQPPFESDAVREYVEWQAKESVLHLEKLKTEYVFGNRHDAWDVTTDQNRYWVITTPTNLYSQKFFPSLDYTITFHVGLAARIMANQRDAKSEERDRLLPAFRKWLQAADAFDRADEAEEFQAVGMRCREALSAAVLAARENAAISATPAGAALKAGDFLGWSEVIADSIASGDSYKEIRSYLKVVARAAWQLVAWLTHARNAFRHDAQLALAATESALSAYAGAIVRFEEAPAERCLNCSSYRVSRQFIPGRRAGKYITVCLVCGWTERAKTTKPVKHEKRGA